VGRALKLQISESATEVPTSGAVPRIGERNGFPIVLLPPDAAPIKLADIQSAEDEL